MRMKQSDMAANAGCLVVLGGAAAVIAPAVHGITLYGSGLMVPVRFLTNLFSKSMPGVNTPLSLFLDLCMDLNALYPFFLLALLIIFLNRKNMSSYKKVIKIVGIVTAVVFIAALISTLTSIN